MDFETMRKMPGVIDIAHETYVINEYGLDAMFLLVGSEKALLIDTGTGVFDLPALIGTITHKPLMVALTHGHPDHAGGIGFFEEVYAHPDDFEAAVHLPYETRKGYAESLLKMNPAAPVTAEDTVAFTKMPAMLPLREGDVIDLGGRKVVIYETPGHTPGGLSFLDVRERILITGDACNPNTLLLAFAGTLHPKQTISTLKKTAEKIAALSPFYDRDYNGHVGYGGSPACRPQAKTIATDMISLCEDILSGKVTGDEEPAGLRGLNARHAVKGAAGVRYMDGAVK